MRAYSFLHRLRGPSHGSEVYRIHFVGAGITWTELDCLFVLSLSIRPIFGEHIKDNSEHRVAFSERWIEVQRFA